MQANGRLRQPEETCPDLIAIAGGNDPIETRRHEEGLRRDHVGSAEAWVRPAAGYRRPAERR